MNTRPPTETEKKLVDIAVQMAIHAAEYGGSLTTEEAAKWAVSQLQQLGFETEPRGMSWAVLTGVRDD